MIHNASIRRRRAERAISGLRSLVGLTMASPSQAAVPPTLKAQLESGGFNYWKSGPANGHRAYLVRHNPNGTVRRYRIALWIRFGQARLAADLIESSAAFRRDLARGSRRSLTTRGDATPS